MSHHGMMGLNGLTHFCHYTKDQTTTNGRFGRLFSYLPPLYTDPDILEGLGKKDGPMDGGTGSDRTSTVPVGQVFFGQFIDHDITLDTSSSLTSVNSASDTVNVRTPTLDLDNIYGDGPEGAPFLYEQNDPFKGVKLLVGADVSGADAKMKADLVRSPRGRAVIGDPRNDENRIISQLQLGMINFHNNVVDYVASKNKYKGHELFEESRKLVTAHYHWAVIYDFLADMCGSAVVWDILSQGRQFYCADEGFPYIPVEFSVAAYRYGHSMAPQKIQVQKNEAAHSLFGTVLGGGFTPLSDLKAVVDYHEIFNTSANRQVQMAEKLDTKMAAILLKLPFVGAGAEASLATRNLLRGQSFLLPSGEVVAAEMGRPETEVDKVSKLADDMSGDKLGGKTPLWFYILAEAERIGRETEPGNFDKGEGLGPVGGRLVAEVLIGLMELDPRSFLSMNRSWSPKDGLGADIVGIGDMLTYTP